MIPRPIPRRPRHESGFTLIELLISLVAGLLIALAVFAVSKDATATFHEESRAATAEVSLRVAVERIRADLMRASFQSSPNVWVDHTLAYPVAGSRVPNTAPAAIQTLQGVRLINGDPSILPLSVVNNLWGGAATPNGLEIMGDLTSTDYFPVEAITAGGICGGQRITLQANTPSMWRILGGPAPQDTLRGIFQPVPQSQFLIRFVDQTGKTQYAPICAGDAVNIAGGGVAAVITVDVSNAGGVKFLTSQETLGNGGIGGFCQGCIINPVHWVRYELRKLDPQGNPGDCAYAPTVPKVGFGMTDKYDVVRTWRDLNGNQLGATEVIAEYGVDLKFAFSADLSAPTFTARPLTVYPLDDAAGNNATIAGNVGPANNNARPQRIRSVRFRISTRAAMADRSDQLIAPPANAVQGAYPLRYCLLTQGCAAGAPDWARMRSIISETTLPNHAKSFD